MKKIVITLFALCLAGVLYNEWARRTSVRIVRIPRFAVWMRIADERFSYSIAPFLFLRAVYYDDYKKYGLSGMQDCEGASTIVHELAHIEREKKMGILVYGYRYLFVKDFALREEMIAIKKEMVIFKERNVMFPFEQRSKDLSTKWFYRNKNQDYARELLLKAWNEL